MENVSSALPDMAEALFTNGFNCSQAVVCAFSERYGIEMSLAAKLATGFGGGCRVGELCGAISGGVLVVGLKHGQSHTADIAAKKNCYAKTQEFVQGFHARHGAKRCCTLLGHDISTPEGWAAAQPLFATVCVGHIRSAVELLEELGY